MVLSVNVGITLLSLIISVDAAKKLEEVLG